MIKKIHIQNTLIFAFVLAISACGGRRTIENFQGSSTAEAAGVMTVRTGWVKDKKRGFHAELWFTNNSKAAIAMSTGRIACSRGAFTGSFRFSKFNNTAVELEPGEQRRLIAICDTGTKSQGDWTFTFRDISTRQNDGSMGKVLANQLILKLVPASR